MINKKLGLMALLASFAVSETMAGDFNGYAVGDVLIGFRNGQANDLVVDAGPISTFTNLAPNTRYVISTFTGDQLGQVATNGVSWSAFTYLRRRFTFHDPAPRPLGCPDGSVAGGQRQQPARLRQRIGKIPPGAKENLNYNVVNTVTAVIEPDISAGNPNYITGLSYRDAYVGATGGSFNNTFSGSPENTTSGSFTSDGNVARSDFYQLPPVANQLGKWLGYFELSTNGVLTYVAYPSSKPVIKSISRAGDVSTISYVTGLYGTYTLRGTNNLSSGISTNWPAISILTSGDTAVHTATDTDSSDIKFYIITAE
ncbi:MAG: hypothetical protein WDM80_02145 [Limisphaerales bacterium]